MLGRDNDDPLFIQVKEAEASVLERFLGTERASTIMVTGWSKARGSCKRPLTSFSAGSGVPPRMA